MITVLQGVLGGAVAYLLGAIPFGYLLARTRGVDIRTVGSGNIGATNVFRAVSKPLGIVTFTLDLLKGLGAATGIPVLLAALFGVSVAGKGMAVFCGVCAVTGHNWSCFLGFRGGKGVATSAGLVMGLAPQGVGVAFGVWLMVFLVTRYVSVASILAAVSLGVVVWWPFALHERYGFWFPAVLTLLAALAIWKHRANLSRLWRGTEPRFSLRGRGASRTAAACKGDAA